MDSDSNANLSLRVHVEHLFIQRSECVKGPLACLLSSQLKDAAENFLPEVGKMDE